MMMRNSLRHCEQVHARNLCLPRCFLYKTFISRRDSYPPRDTLQNRHGRCVAVTR